MGATDFRDLTAVIRAQLDQHLAEIETTIDSDVLAFVGPILFRADELIRRSIELIDGKRPRLAVILDTEGGVVEIVERMVDAIRHHYHDVSFYVPDRAMSAGTVFALSGDAIWMDYFSVLGPIDPQVQKEDETLVPALAYLIQYDRLIKRSAEGVLTTAELALLQKLDLGELQQFEEARELSVSLLKKWLVAYKFKDWTTTETRGLPVTEDMKVARAASIARALSDPQQWHSHGRGISMNVLRGDDIKLKIDDFGKDPTLSKLLREYLQLLREFMAKNGLRSFGHTRAFF